MPSDSSTEKIVPSLQKRPKWTPTACTIIYIILFPFLFYMGMLSPMVVDGTHTPPFLVALSIFAVFLIPLSLPVSIYLMWSRYSRNQHEKARFFSRLPLFTFAGVFLILDGIPFLYRVLCRMIAS
jgi:magnesium-transporting ATPase (P-type)